MPQIGAYDAKTRLPELLRQVRKGKRFTITVRGKPVAELVPSEGNAARDADAAVEAMLTFERVGGVSAKEIKDWIAEGRR